MCLHQPRIPLLWHWCLQVHPLHRPSLLLRMETVEILMFLNGRAYTYSQGKIIGNMMKIFLLPHRDLPIAFGAHSVALDDRMYSNIEMPDCLLQLFATNACPFFSRNEDRKDASSVTVMHLKLMQMHCNMVNKLSTAVLYSESVCTNLANPISVRSYSTSSTVLHQPSSCYKEQIVVDPIV